MTISEANSEIDPAEAGEKLADKIAEDAFDEAMRNPDGFVSVELIERYLRIIEARNQAKLEALRKTTEAPDGTKDPLGRFTVIDQEIIAQFKGSGISEKLLLGRVASLRTMLSDTASTN